MTANLPALVTRVGGALQQVVTDIEQYTDERHPLDRKGQMAIARLVEDRPELNTEPRIALMVDAVTWHGVEQTAELSRLIDEHDIERVHLALDYLYEVGERNRGTQQADKPKLDMLGYPIIESHQFSDMALVRRVVSLIEQLEANGIAVDGPESLDNIVTKLGGLNQATDVNDEMIHEAIEPSTA